MTLLFKDWLMESNNGKVLYIARGAPGSGKSTKARSLVQNKEQVFSTDDLFGTGEDYKKNIAVAIKDGLMGHYHGINQQKVEDAMKKGVSPIVVDNTNINMFAMSPYVKLARLYDYEVRFVEPDSPQWNRIKQVLKDKNPEDIEKAAEELSNLNIHGVPKAVIARMLTNWHNDPKVEDFD